jgi:N-acetylglucosaminyl-diphospho-decaprenol L-rhamnosyltransferase
LSSFRFHSWFSEIDGAFRLGLLSKVLRPWSVVVPLPDQPVRIDWVGGAAFMIRKEVIDAIGLLDEGYFVYYEETDYCLRARRAGWESWYVPQSRIIHLEGQCTGVSDKTKRPKRRPRYWFESRRRYFELNHGRLHAFAIDVAWALGYATFRLRRWLQGKPDTDPPHFMTDFIRYSFLSRRPHVR